MRKTINGRVYDTDKALVVCEIWEGNRGDFRHIDAKLYCTPRSRQFFLAGFGGAMTQFTRRNSDGSFSGDNKIIPLSESDALEYAERYASEEAIAEFFNVTDADDLSGRPTVRQFDARGEAVITIYPRPGQDDWEYTSVNYDLNNLYDIFGRSLNPAPFDVIERVFDRVWNHGGAKTIDDLAAMIMNETAQ